MSIDVLNRIEKELEKHEKVSRILLFVVIIFMTLGVAAILIAYNNADYRSLGFVAGLVFIAFSGLAFRSGKGIEATYEEKAGLYLAYLLRATDIERVKIIPSSVLESMGGVYAHMFEPSAEEIATKIEKTTKSQREVAELCNILRSNKEKILLVNS